MSEKLRSLSCVFLWVGLALAITSVALVGVHFRHTDMTWTKHGFSALGATELASTLLVWVVIILGFFSLCTMKKGLIIIFIVLDILSALFILGIAIFAFIGTKTRYWDEYVGCNASYKGLLSIWNSIDGYLYSVDSILCSEVCPCYMNETTTSLFVSNSSTAPYFNQWVKYNVSLLPIRFQDCNDTAISLARNEYYMSNAYYNHTFNPKWFHKYYKYIEEHFKCTGFCGTTYYNGKSRTNGKIVKYLFSSIERGIPEHFGCLGAIMDWLRKTLNAWAAVGLVLFVVLIILFILALFLLCDQSNNMPDEEEQPSSEKPQQDEDEEKNKKIEEEQKEPVAKEIPVPKVDDVNLNYNPNDNLKIDLNAEANKEPDEQKDDDGFINTSYQIPEKQKEEIDIKFNPSIL